MTDLPEAAEIEQAIRAGLAKLLAPEDLHQIELAAVCAETPMLSLPVDSAVLMALMTELEDTFSVYIDEEAAFGFALVGDVSEYIRHRLTEKAARQGAP